MTMTGQEIFDLIRKKKSFLCIGLDSDIRKLPPHLRQHEDPVFEFNKKIIDATLDLAVAYKPNLGFYESNGVAGWKSLERTIRYLKDCGGEVFTIADAKRGDIGNTSEQYARAFLEMLDFDAITVAPYMGEDSVKPFLSFRGKWIILLALTSNRGAGDFQFLPAGNGSRRLYEEVLEKSCTWGTPDNLMFVAGATNAGMFAGIRKIVPEHFLLVPGVGAQGGSLEEVAKYGLNRQCGLLVNSSRAIIFASAGEDFADRARQEALSVQKSMETILEAAGLLTLY
jgi:orotidine-5'-phosphate decarboxylase